MEQNAGVIIIWFSFVSVAQYTMTCLKTCCNKKEKKS